MEKNQKTCTGRAEIPEIQHEPRTKKSHGGVDHRDLDETPKKKQKLQVFLHSYSMKMFVGERVKAPCMLQLLQKLFSH